MVYRSLVGSPVSLFVVFLAVVRSIDCKQSIPSSRFTKPGVLTEGICRLDQIPNKGIGVTAARDIKSGERVMKEAPLFWLTTDSTGVSDGGIMPHLSPTLVSETLQRVKSELDKLSGDEQRAYYELCGFDRLSGSELTARTLNLSNKREEEGQGPNALDIFRTNALPMARGKSGLFPTILRLNNDCRPNAHYNWDEEYQCATIHAITDIREGEEICISYMGPYYPRRDRRGYLSRNFGFTCMCPVCSLTGEEAMLSDHRRATLAGLESAAQQAASEGKAEAALSIAPHRLQLLQEEGLANAANLYKCELDVFFALSGMSSNDRSPEALGTLLASAPTSPGSVSSALRDQLLDWITRAYNHSAKSKGESSSAAKRCLSYIEVLRFR